jgi:Do/DeqQ family serine protease
MTALSLLFAAQLAPLPARAGALPAALDGEVLPSLAPMLEKVTPAVVNVASKRTVQVRSPFMDDPFFRRFFAMPDIPRERVQQSLGSGVIVDAARGYVLTNNHVIENADEIEVTLADGRTLEATRVGTDPDTDVAVIRIPAEDLAALPLADSAGLRVGDFVVAVGNPFGLGQTVTGGLVSALGRSGLRGIGVQNFIQTDASINPGNSGGALVNLRGELIGINTAIFSPSGGNVGIGFAIPSNLARDVMRQLLAFGEVKRGTLGLSTQDLDQELATALGVEPGKGAVVTRVAAGSPAAAAGIKPGDVISAIDGKPVRSRADLANLEGLLPVGSTVRVTLLREGATLTVTAALRAVALRKLEATTLDARLDGARLADIEAKFRDRGLSGVLVSQVTPGSRAAGYGIAPGDLITAVNQREIEDLAALEAVLAAKPRQVLLTLVRGRQGFYLLLE